MRAVPHPRKREDPNAFTQRQPTIEEWLPAAAQFAQRPDIRGTGTFSMFDKLNPRTYFPPRDWQPTPWFPLPFNKEQLAQIDRLPTLGFIHRPTFVKLTDADGKKRCTRRC
ncbi:hypothetical protein ACL9RI_16720 [Janthinobacterium sp. Mn2066]|uniref:hypothetical protein n=1 Tax=Janthinobacterium sp. Mn2066 TaxID=3395264 RepID=UPI003BBAF4B6